MPDQNRAVRARRVAVVAILVFCAACGSGTDRPADDTWTPIWERYRDLIPTADEVLDEGEPLCDELVGTLRTGRQELLPTPTEALDDVVHAWINHAQSVVFDCPTDDPSQLKERLRDLAIISAEVDAGLAIEAG